MQSPTPLSGPGSRMSITRADSFACLSESITHPQHQIVSRDTLTRQRCNSAPTGQIAQLTTNDIIVAIIGPVGCGKSSFIAKAIGSADEGVGHDLCAGSYTGDIAATKYTTENGTNVVLVDTPGFGDTNLSEIQILFKISKWLYDTYEKKVFFSAVLCLHPIIDNRVRWTSCDRLPLLRELCGNNPKSQLVLVTTMWDDVEEKVGIERLAELKENYWKPMIERGFRTFCYRNTPESAAELLQIIIDASTKRVYLSEPVTKNSTPLQTNLQPRDNGLFSQNVLSTDRRNYFSDVDFEPGGTGLVPWHPSDNELQEAQLNEMTACDVIILILGPVGSGKSSFIANVTGNDAGVGHTLCRGAFTRQVTATNCAVGKFVNAVLVDTPGLDDPDISEVQILKMVSSWLTETYKKKVLLSAILYFHSMTDTRLRWIPSKHLRVFQSLCGRDAICKMALVTTMWDEVEEAYANSKITTLKRSWKAMTQNDSTVFHYRNQPGSAGEVLQNVIDMVLDRRNALLEKEISSLKKVLADVATAKGLFVQLESLATRRLEILQSAETDVAMDPESAEALRGEYDEVKAELADVLRQIRTRVSVRQRVIARFWRVIRAIQSKRR